MKAIRKSMDHVFAKVRFPRSALYAVGGVAGLGLAVWAVQQGSAQFHLRQAETYLQRGFGTLAADVLEPVRGTLSKSARGCSALLAAYFAAQRPDRLEWASQACLVHVGESVEAYVGLAATRELQGRDQDALGMLAQITQAFPKSPEPYFRMVQIFRRAKKDNEAALALVKASELAPKNAQIALDALQALSGIGKWDEARKIAERIKGEQTDSPEVKLVIARALIKGGDRNGAKPLVDAASALMEKKPEIKDALAKAYADVFNPDAVVADATSADKSRAPASAGSKKKTDKEAQ